MELTAKHKQMLQYAGYPVLALVVFFGALWASFPAERVRAKVESLLSPHMDVQIESIDKGILPGNFTLTGIVLKTRPQQSGEKPAVIVVDELDLDIGLLSLLAGTASVDVEAVVGGGTIEAELAVSSDGALVEVSTEQLAMGAMPGLKSLFAGLPIEGGINVDAALELPNFKWDEATGKIALACPNCVVGPGKVKPRMDDRSSRSRRMSAFASEGVTLPKLNLGDANVVIVFDEGTATFEKFEAVSPDGELHAEGYIDMRPSFAASEPHICFKFKFSDQLKQVNPKVMGMEAGMEKARRDDGYIGMRMTGTMAKPRRIGSRACIPGQPPGSTRGSDRIARPRGRADRSPPTITTTAPREADEDEGQEDPPEPPELMEDSARPIITDDANPLDEVTNGYPPAIPPPRTSGPSVTRDDVALDPSRLEQIEADPALTDEEDEQQLEEEDGEILDEDEPLDDEEYQDMPTDQE